MNGSVIICLRSLNVFRLLHFQKMLFTNRLKVTNVEEIVRAILLVLLGTTSNFIIYSYCQKTTKLTIFFYAEKSIGFNNKSYKIN